MATVFITGAGGFMGSRLASELLRRGHTVRGLVRRGPAPAGCEAVMGNALDSGTWADRIQGCDTFVHLVGVAHPSPAKAAQFRSIDLAGARVAIAAARATGVAHFVYVSVAHPAPVMREYIAARTEAEAALRASGLNATIPQPWYVLGPPMARYTCTRLRFRTPAARSIRTPTFTRSVRRTNSNRESGDYQFIQAVGNRFFGTFAARGNASGVNDTTSLADPCFFSGSAGVPEPASPGLIAGGSLGIMLLIPKAPPASR